MQEFAPFTVGCFGSKDLYPISLTACRGLYSGCNTSDKILTTDFGSGAYKLDCPCFDKTTHSNANASAVPGYLWPKGFGGLSTTITFKLKGMSAKKIDASDVLKTSLRTALSNVLDLKLEYIGAPVITASSSTRRLLQALEIWDMQAIDSSILTMVVTSSLDGALVKSLFGNGTSFIIKFKTAAISNGYTDNDIASVGIEDIVTEDVTTTDETTVSEEEKANANGLLLLLLLLAVIPIGLALYYFIYGYPNCSGSYHQPEKVCHPIDNDLELAPRNS